MPQNLPIIDGINAPTSKSSFLPILIICLVSGLCWFFANTLYGEYWYLLWVAPIPILLLSFRLGAKATFGLGFVSYAIGRLSWFRYLQVVSSLPFAIVLTLALPLIFALVLLLVRKWVLTHYSWTSIFALPVLFTATEFIMMRFSPDGTASSLAYTQMNCLPIIQVASVMGILGITFMVTFIPSAIAVGWWYRRQKKTRNTIFLLSLLILALVFGFGEARLAQQPSEPPVKMGLVVADEAMHFSSQHPDFMKEKGITEYYAKQISLLAQQGAKLVVLPEKAININIASAPLMKGILADAARQNKVFVIAGYVNYGPTHVYNSALVIDDGGKVLVDYNKVYLVSGWENWFTKGSGPGLFSYANTPAGIAICKDLDFPQYIHQYGASGIRFLVVPAWDFVVDDWLHCRMAVLRGVENGFAELRTAREGRLTISDPYGRITAEAFSNNDKAATLTGWLVPEKINTVYSKWGDWFGWCIIVAAVLFIPFGVLSRRKENAG